MTAESPRVSGVVDYLCNGFTPDRRAVWDGAIGDSEIAVKIRRNPEDSFCEPDAMVDRMDELGIDTLLLPTGDVGTHGTLDPFDQEHVANRWEETEKLVGRWPGRFAALALINPLSGMRAVRDVRTHLADPWVVGCYLHTHSFDLPFDHADLYPFYTVCTDADVPVVVQAGTSGGLMPSACGQPIGIDRAALYFPDTRFVLSHLGWPWENEAIAMALKFANVYLGTGAYPPRHWSELVVRFLRGPGRTKMLFGTNFPTVGHRHALGQLAELELDPAVEAALVGGTARTVFTRLGPESTTSERN